MKKYDGHWSCAKSDIQILIKSFEAFALCDKQNNVISK